MRRLPSVIALALALGLLPALAVSPAGAQRHQSVPPGDQGLQGGWAVDDGGQILFEMSVADTLDRMQEAGAGWVRINFRLGACFKDWTSRGCKGADAPTALQTYEGLIALATATHGMQVLGLLSPESWHGSQKEWIASNAETTGGSGDNAYIRAFAKSAAGVLAQHFRGKVAQWQVWNEPNAWTDCTPASPGCSLPGGSFIYPSNFAWLLKRSYDAIKAGDPAAEVVSGGLFGHDLDGATVTIVEGGQTRPVRKRGDFRPAARPGGGPPGACASPKVPSGADYLCETYSMGIAKARWKPPYPLDHVGQHIYIDQGGATTAGKLGQYLDDLRGAYLFYEGATTAKKTHVTEIGWRSDWVGEPTQANNLKLSYDTFKAISYVERAYWFQIQDIPVADLFFGLVRPNDSKKPSFAAYQQSAK